MKRTVSALLCIPGLALLLLAFTALLGLGVLRAAPTWAVVVSAAAVVFLPVIAVGVAGRGRLEVLATSALVWPLAVLLFLPTYFPGERTAGVSAGMAFWGAPWGADASMQAAQVGDVVGALLGPELMAGKPPPPELVAAPEAPPSVGAPAPLVSWQEGDTLSLPYEGEGRSLRIPVVFEDQGVERELWMLFDTGATYTTLTRDALALLGVRVPADAPVVELHTANGAAEAQLVLLDRVWLGGFPVEGVTVAVCDLCGSDDSRGLLGLNVSGQFTVTVDPGQRMLILEPQVAPGRPLDLAHWVDLQATATAYTDGRVEVEVTGDNLSERDIALVDVSIECQDAVFETQLDALIPGEQAATQVSLPRGTNCDPYRIRLTGGRW